jgi:hypothetical protein
MVRPQQQVCASAMREAMVPVTMEVQEYLGMT